MWETNNVSGVIASAEKFIDGYLADFPAGKLIFSTIPMPDDGYPKTKKNVNTRISEYTELIGTNGMHPVAEGSYMIADGILPIFTLLD